MKAYVLQPYMKGVTELRGKGTWFDSKTNSPDYIVDNVLLEVEYGETESEISGNALKSCLQVINDLEINEDVLYLRMINIEQSTL